MRMSNSSMADQADKPAVSLTMKIAGACALAAFTAGFMHLMAVNVQARRSDQCRRNLQNIGAAAHYVAGQGRLFPSLNLKDHPSEEVAVSALFRGLINAGHLDVPRSQFSDKDHWNGNDDYAFSLICPLGTEKYVHPAASLPVAGWHWGDWKSKSSSQPGNIQDPPLRENGELSFGWRRQDLKSRRAKSTDVLSTCKTVHPDGRVSVLFADGRAEFVAVSSERYKKISEAVVGAPAPQ
jgi:hypothetical protein